LLEPLPQQQVVGVELDPEVIRLYGDFFPQHHGLELVCADAQSFLEQQALCFDLILVDVFIDRSTPAHLLKKEFLMLLASHLNAEGSCLFNRIEENEPEPAVQAFRATFAAAFGQMRTFRTGMNTFYFNR
jgi:spermidine synthase